MKLAKKLYQTLFSAKSQPLNIAILTPVRSGTVERFINHTIKHLEVMSKRLVKATQYSNIVSESQFDLLAQDMKTNHYDLLFAIAQPSGVQAQRLYLEHKVTIPTLILTYEDILRGPIASHMSALLIPQNGPLLYRIITQTLPLTKKVLICANSKTTQLTREYIDLETLLIQSNIATVTIDITQPEHLLLEEIACHAPSADVLVMLKDVTAFNRCKDIITITHTHHCAVLAGELLAIHHGADLAFGYNENTIAKEYATELLRISQNPMQMIRTAQTRQELHCKPDKLDEQWIHVCNTTPTSEYEIKVIDAPSNEESEPSLLKTQGQ